MNTALVVIIALTLLFIAWQQRRHERWVAQVVERITAPPVYYVPTPRPAPLPRPLMYSDLFPEEPFELVQRGPAFWEVAPTRVMRPSIHPRFENYGTDVSIAPTVGVT